MNQRGGGCGEPRSHHGTPAWATEQDSISKKEIGRKEGREGGREEGRGKRVTGVCEDDKGEG